MKARSIRLRCPKFKGFQDIEKPQPPAIDAPIEDEEAGEEDDEDDEEEDDPPDGVDE